MKNFKWNSKKLIMLILSGFVLVSTSGCGKKVENNYQNSVIESNYYNEVIDSIKEDEGITSINNANQEKETNNNDKPSNNNEINKIELSEEDDIIIKEFNSIKANITNYLDSEDFANVKDKAKGIFINIVDFLFYDGEIKGIKFNDLTEEGKKQVLICASSIDNMITKKFPTYKEDISTTTKDAYTKASELIKKGSQNLSDFSKEKLGEDNYNAIMNAKDEIIEYSKEALDIIGDYSSKTWTTVKDKVKNWYEEFRNN